MSVVSSRHRHTDINAVIAWLSVIAVMIFAIVIVGGVTRLTGSGLSIVEWQPVAGILPPLSEEAWMEVFTKYKATPQYMHENSGMTLEGFKDIFFWEYWHRVLGRMIGMAFAVPLVWFLMRRNLEPKLVKKLIALFLLGGAQGALGWFMVKSGLVDIPRVSHFRLAAHLGLALFVLCAIVWVIMEIWPKRVAHAGAISRRHVLLRRVSVGLLALVAVQIVWGAFTAGLRAGYGFNTFPAMNGFVIPPGIGALSGFWADLTSNNVTVQFTHRLMGWILLLGALGVVVWARTMALSWGQRLALNGFAVAVAIQFLLGVATILSVVHLPIAVAHQGGGALVAIAATMLVYSLRQPRS